MATKNKRPYKRFGQDFSGESKTQQHFTDAADVNNIVATYDQTGLDPYADRKARERFGDGTYRTYLDAQNTVCDVQSRFNELPLAVREQYNDDVTLYLAAAEAQLEAPEEPVPDTPKDVPEDVSEAPTDAPENG